jgi:polysaccharide export outer membrane protein
MRGMKNSVRVFALLVCACAAYLLAPLARSQTLVPTPEQLQMLRSLSPEQQEALRKRFGGEPVVAPGTTGAQSGIDGVLTQGLPPLSQEERDRMDRERAYLRGGDSVLVEVGFYLPPLEQTQLDTTPGTAVAGATPGSAAAPASPPMQPQQAPLQSPPPVALLPDEEQRLQRFIDLIRSKNPYRLSADGVLQLPGLNEIPLAGLTEEQAGWRLRTEKALQHLEVRLVRLPLERFGTEALKPFGYDLFEAASPNFMPLTDVPVPADYIVGSGDQLSIQLYGNDSRSLILGVSRDGTIDFPQLGPIHVAGMRFTSAKDAIESRVARQMTGVQANVSMSETRSIRVFVVGEAKRPGSYTISGLGTVTSALYAAGGAKPIGSLRNIELKRQGKVVKTFDLYDLLLRGDTTDDAKLLPGDVIFIPPIGPTASIYGEVQRPAIYEIRNDTSVGELVALAGGLAPSADTSRAVLLTQIAPDQRRIAVDVALRADPGGSARLVNGDVLRIDRLRPTLDSGIRLQGHVHTAGVVAYRDGIRLSDVIRSVDELRTNADIHYLLIRRERLADRRVSVFSADLARALSAPGSDADILLEARDQITVFDLESGRDHVIRPLLDELRLQASFSHPTELVTIDGHAKVPGEYPLEPGMRVSDLVRAGGGLDDAAYGAQAELSRYSVVNGESRRTELIVVNLAAALRGDPAADVELQSFDSLSIKEVQEWGEQEQITLVGEVRYPGKYSIRRGETLKSVIARAGGLNEYAFPEGSVFTRTELKEREQRQLDVLAARLQNDLATLALQGAAANQAQAGTALTVGQSLLSQLKSSKAVGRLVIDLPRTLRAGPGSAGDLALKGGDQLIVPRIPQEVTVLGEVQNATSHLYRPELVRDDYIGLSGGATRKADRANIYVVRADGSVHANEGNRWFRRATVQIRQGDTVVVPFDAERLPALPFWQSVTQILYHLAISAAAVNSF